MTIRKMKIEDYEGVYSLWINTKGMGLNDVDDSKEGISKFIKRNPNTCFVAEKDSEIIGVIIGGNDGRRGYIYHTSVKETERKQGIATKLMTECLNAMKEEGISKVALVVFKRNEVGNEFWNKQGFIVRNDLNYRNKSLIELVRIDT